MDMRCRYLKGEEREQRRRELERLGVFAQSRVRAFYWGNAHPVNNMPQELH